MSSRIPFRLSPIAAIFGIVFATPAPAIGPLIITRTVTTCVDSSSDPGSLRSALSGLTESEELIVNFDLTCSKISLANGALVSTAGSVLLNGPTDQALTIDGNRADRVLIHYGHGSMTISNLTLTNGLYTRGSRGGGAIYAVGNIELDHSTVSNSQVYGTATKGGNIYSLGSVTLTSSTVSLGRATKDAAAIGYGTFGGGVYSKNGFFAYSSTVAANEAYAGGGVFAIGPSAIVGSTLDSNTGRIAAALFVSDTNITNSTIAGNVAGPDMEGLCSVMKSNGMRLYNSTVAGNSCSGLGGVVSTGTVTMVSSIVSSNSHTNGSVDVLATVTGNSNIVGTVLGTLPGDTIRDDPRLMPLVNNGGPTLTMALSSQSPAIDAGDNPLNLTTDQRGDGFPRALGAQPDIGAFESNDKVFANGFE